MRVFLGIDLGTSGLKVSLVDEAGTVRAEGESAYEPSARRPGRAEIEPAVWAAAMDAARRQLATAVSDAELAGIGFSGQMHGVVLVDAEGAPVRPALLWPDLRAAEVLPAWRALAAEVHGRLGNPVVAGMTGPLLTWLDRYEPAALAATSTVLCPKDWLRATLTGDRVTDRSDSSATLLWDVVGDDWSAPALRLAGVAEHQLPEARGSAELVGTADGTPVAAGGADVACAIAALEQAAEARGRLHVIVGSGVQLVRSDVLPRPRLDPATHLFADTAEGWYEMIGVRNGGLSLDWVQGALRLSWPALVAAARSALASELLFVPFLTGERGHIAPVEPRVGWTGSTERTGVAERAQAAFDALAFTVRRSIELLGDSETPVTLSGGVAREPYVRQLIADCLGRRLTYVPLRSASAAGAALLAARAVGIDVRLPDKTVVIDPRDDHRLAAAYPRWCQAVDAG